MADGGGVVVAAIGLGSNLGDRRRSLSDALHRLARLGKVIAISSTYETAPVGGPEQGPYLNAVALVETSLSPSSIVDECQSIERELGRERRERWGPRTIDLDLLLYGQRTVDLPGVTVPHPRLTERRFVLEPLHEVLPGAALPDGRTIASLLPGVADQEVARVGGGGNGSRAAALLVFLVTGLVGAAIWIALGYVL